MCSVSIGNVARSAIAVIARTLSSGLRGSTSSEVDGPLVPLQEPTPPRGLAAAAAEQAASKETLLMLLERLSLNDMNRLLFRSNLEEHEDPHNGGAYSIQSFGELAYCGLQGSHSAHIVRILVSVLELRICCSQHSELHLVICSQSLKYFYAPAVRLQN